MDAQQIPNPHIPRQHKHQEDFALSGIFVTFGLLLVVGVLIYLLTVQTNASNCEPEFGQNGEIIKDCPAKNDVSAPTGPAQPGQIEFLDNLQPQQNKIPGLDTAQ